MNRATKLALINLNNDSPINLKTALFHSTPILYRRRRTQWEFRPNFNARRQRKFYGKQEMLRNVSAFFAENPFKGLHDHDEFEPSSSNRSSWFRNLNGGPQSFNGTRGRMARKKGFQFYEDNEEDGVDRGFYSWSFVNDESAGSSSRSYNSTRGSWNRGPQFEDSDDFDDDDDDDYYDESERVGADLRKDRMALGLSGSGPLSLEDVKNAYRACALKWHPDRHNGPSKAVAEEKFKVCSAAYQSLCDNLALN